MLDQPFFNNDPNNTRGVPHPRFPRRRRQWPVLVAVVAVSLAHGLLAAVLSFGSDPIVGAVAAIVVSLSGGVVLLAAALEM